MGVEAPNTVPRVHAVVRSVLHCTLCVRVSMACCRPQVDTRIDSQELVRLLAAVEYPQAPTVVRPANRQHARWSWSAQVLAPTLLGPLPLSSRHIHRLHCVVFSALSTQPFLLYVACRCVVPTPGRAEEAARGGIGCPGCSGGSGDCSGSSPASAGRSTPNGIHRGEILVCLVCLCGCMDAYA